MKTRDRFAIDLHPTNGGSRRPVEIEALPTPELISYIAGKAALLVERQVELAKAEVRADVRAEINMAVWLGVAATCAVVAASLLCVSLVLGLGAAELVSSWLAALLLAGVLLFASIVAGLIGWGKRVAAPLATTRHTLRETVDWARQRLTRGRP